MDKVMPVVGGLVGMWAASKMIPVMYRWELIPGIASPEWHAKAATIKYNHYTEGIVYSPYDTGEPITEIHARAVRRQDVPAAEGRRVEVPVGDGVGCPSAAAPFRRPPRALA
ncbi:unnamed protein product [Prorocentrum cordatum]|uniref:Uncharacterized protein n=1 Tax=Prorocentrum cordatum TaxID=2364126 RepID=A0ABN9TG73_9DINO|nr:unnamed protein product [Polarella glacialis]